MTGWEYCFLCTAGLNTALAVGGTELAPFYAGAAVFVFGAFLADVLERLL